MAADSINILVGDRLTEVCLTGRRGRNVRIGEGFTFLTPEGSVSDGMIQNVDLYGKELLSQFTKHNVAKGSDITFTVSSSRILAREVMIPPVKENRIAATVEANAGEYLPVGLDEYQITFTILGQVKEPQPGWRLIVQGAPRALLESYAELCTFTHMELKAIDTSMNSLFQVLRTVKADGTTVFANISPSNTEITALKDGEYLLQRNQPIGGDALMLPYMSANGIDMEKYSDIQNNITIADVMALPPEEISHVQGHIDMLVKNILRVCDYIRTNKQVNADRIVLSGYSAHLPMISDMLQKETDIPVSFIEDLPGITAVSDNKKQISTYISVVGSMMQPVELLPASVQAAKSAKTGLTLTASDSESLTGPIIIAIVLAAAGIVLALFGGLQYLMAKQDLTDIKRQIKELEPAKEAYDAYVTYTGNDQNLQVVRDAADGKNVELNNFFAEFEAKMPSSILVATATCAQDGITLDVTVPDMDTAAIVIDQLRQFESFDVVSVSDVADVDTEAGTKAVSFTVICNYPVPQAPEDTAATDTSGEGSTDSSSSSDGSSGSDSSSTDTTTQ